jgi:hypothetical protein
MSIGYFTDKSIRPSENDVKEILGISKDNWDLLFEYLAVELKLKREYKFHGVNYGWAIRFNESERSVIALGIRPLTIFNNSWREQQKLKVRTIKNDLGN